MQKVSQSLGSLTIHAGASVISPLSYTWGDSTRLTIICECDSRSTVFIHLPEPKEYSVDIMLHENAEMRFVCISLDHQDALCAIRSKLVGEHAVSNIDVVCLADQKDNQKITAENIFEAKDGGGEIRMRAVAQDTAHVTLSGMITIGEDGTGTQTYLTEDVLMLDPTAKVDAVPGLEIKTNDVKASHSATVSKVTPEDLFYFGSRGIEEKLAREMYIEGFLGELLEGVN